MTGPLLVVGAGSRTYREYAFRSVAAAHPVHLLADRPPTWELPYLAGHGLVDTSDPAALLAAAADLAPAGVLTWDDTRVVQTATVAEKLGLPGAGTAAALACRDKHRTREALAAAGVPQAASVLVETLPAARAAAEQVGYPLVLKPRALNASMGVVRVDEPAQLAARFRIARGARPPAGMTTTEVPPGGVLVEEYLDGEEVSVDAAWVDGAMLPAFVARKRTGWPPYFEETGHVVDAADPLRTDPALLDVVAAAHRAVGFGSGWTHTELRLTTAGPRVVEVNARLGGDRIPQLGQLALGIDAALAAATVATGGRPDLAPDRARAAAIGFRYPESAGTARAVVVDRTLLPAGVEVEVVALPGQDLALPPAGHVTGRYALVLAVAGTAAEALAAVDAAAPAVRLHLLPTRR